jgi:hypothetical protein
MTNDVLGPTLFVNIPPHCKFIYNIYKECMNKRDISNGCYFIKNEYKRCMREFNISK